MGWSENLPQWTIHYMLVTTNFTDEDGSNRDKPGTESFRRYYKEGKVTCDVDWTGVGSITVNGKEYTNTKPLNMKQVIERGKNLEDHGSIF